MEIYTARSNMEKVHFLVYKINSADKIEQML